MAHKLLLLLVPLAAVRSERLERLDAASISGDWRARQQVVRVHAQHQVGSDTTTAIATTTVTQKEGSSGTAASGGNTGRKDFMTHANAEIKQLEKVTAGLATVTSPKGELTRAGQESVKAAKHLEHSFEQLERSKAKQDEFLEKVTETLGDLQFQKFQELESTLKGDVPVKVVEVVPTDEEKVKGLEDIVISDFSEHGIEFVKGTGNLSSKTQDRLKKEFETVLQEAKAKAQAQSKCIVCIYYSTSAKQNTVRNGLMDDREATLEAIVNEHVKDAVGEGGYEIKGRYPTYEESRFGGIVVKFFDIGKGEPVCDEKWRGDRLTHQVSGDSDARPRSSSVSSEA